MAGPRRSYRLDPGALTRCAGRRVVRPLFLPGYAIEVVRGMSELLVGREPVADRSGPPLIELAGVEKVYRTGKVEYRALRGVDLTIDGGDMVAIVGPVGQRQVDDHEHDHRHRPPVGRDGDGRRPADRRDERGGARDLARPARRRRVPVLPAAADADRAGERDAAAGLLAPRAQARARARSRMHNLELVGLADKADNLPSELSGGQQQRVAIARALAADPPLLIGDEPTGNLDTRTAAEMFDLLQRLNAEGSTILYVTHDRELAARAHRTVTIRDGVVAA